MKQKHMAMFIIILILGVIIVSQSRFGAPGMVHKKMKDDLEAVSASRENCLKEWPQLNLNHAERERLSELGIAEITKAGEHPSKNAMKVIISSLRKAALANSSLAQKKLGFFVVSYWVTDELFWPNEKAIAIDALAMLRVYALKESQAGQEISDDLLRGLALTPPTFDEELPFEFPQEWLNQSVKMATDLNQCHQLITK